MVSPTTRTGCRDTLTIGGTGQYADRPTITYTPVSGNEFAASLLTPISPEHLFALVQAGWPAEVILRLTVHSMNGIENEWAAPAHRRQADPRFVELLQVWNRLRKARAIGLRREGEQAAARIVIYRTEQGVSDEVAADLDLLTKHLDLDPRASEYRLSYGLVPDEPNEIVVLTSSILEIMNELAWRVDVPSEHIEDQRTGPAFTEETEGVEPLIRIHHSKDRPDNAYVSIRDRDFWFYIDDRDMVSKRTFAMLQIILSLTESGETARGPVVSLTN